eukprot:4232871-Prymnesium_polylepis.2
MAHPACNHAITQSRNQTIKQSSNQPWTLRACTRAAQPIKQSSNQAITRSRDHATERGRYAPALEPPSSSSNQAITRSSNHATERGRYAPALEPPSSSRASSRLSAVKPTHLRPHPKEATSQREGCREPPVPVATYQKGGGHISRGRAAGRERRAQEAASGGAGGGALRRAWEGASLRGAQAGA